MNTLANDTIFQIMQYIDDLTLYSLCQTNKRFYHLYRDEYFWKQRGLLRFASDFTVLADKSNKSYKQVYELASDLSSLLLFLQKWQSEVHSIVELNNLEDCNLFSFSYGLDTKEDTLPKEIGRLQKIKSFYTVNTQLSKIPKEIGNCKNLESLTLSNNQLTVLPKEIGNLKNLQLLDISSNQLTSLPKEIGQLQKLRRLYAYTNKLKEIPEEIGTCENLEELSLAENQLTSLPKEIGQLQKLQYLDVSDNQLIDFPTEILWERERLTDLHIGNNPLSDISIQKIKKINENSRIIKLYI